MPSVMLMGISIYQYHGSSIEFAGNIIEESMDAQCDVDGIKYLSIL